MMLCSLQNGHGPVVSALLLAGANINAVTNEGKTPADLARLRDFQNVAQYLQSQSLREDTQGCDTVLRAASTGRVSCLKRLYQEHIVNGVNPEGQSPLMLAVMNNHPYAVTFLLEAGADAFARDRLV